jgi:hypothetical protein
VYFLQKTPWTYPDKSRRRIVIVNEFGKRLPSMSTDRLQLSSWIGHA